MTSRSKVLDELIEQNHKVPVGKDGFVRIVDYMGNESSIVQAARVSYGAGTKSSREDRDLLRYLVAHSHTSPLEQCEIKFHIRIEMDTFRQMVRHRMASLNEYSTRYSEAIDSMAWTDSDEWRLQGTGNKQGSSGFLTDWPESTKDNPSKVDYIRGAALNGKADFTPGEYLSYRESQLHELAETVYKERLAFDVAREQARKDLPLSNYTELYWKMDAHNLLHFLRLRLDSHAQLEIRRFAQVMADYVSLWMPNLWQAFLDYRINSISFSAGEQLLMGAMLAGQENKLSITWPETLDRIKQIAGLSKREVTEFVNKYESLEARSRQWLIERSAISLGSQ